MLKLYIFIKARPGAGTGRRGVFSAVYTLICLWPKVGFHMISYLLKRPPTGWGLAI
jgi:hypothetical protein